MPHSKIICTVFMILSTWLFIVGVVNRGQNEKELMLPVSIVLASSIVGFSLSNRDSADK